MLKFDREEEINRVLTMLIVVLQGPTEEGSLLKYCYYYYYDSIYLWMPYKKQAKPGAASVTQGP